MISGLIIGNDLWDTEEVLASAELYGNVSGLPYAILTQLLEPYGGEHPSASQISGGLWRRAVLERLIPFYASPNVLMAMLRGTLIHKGLQGVVMPIDLSIMREKRLTVHLPHHEHVILSGQIDAYFGKAQRLEDYKTCTKMPALIKTEHAMQLSFYCWFLRWSGYPVQQAAINYISWDNTVQITNTLLPGNKIGSVMDHPFMVREETFESYAYDGWAVIYQGFTNNKVPAKYSCSQQYCSWCPVKWACDMIPYEGGEIDPLGYDQRKV